MKYIIREIFTAKPGQAGKLARLFKKTMGHYPKTRIMTDMVGPYNTVVMEIETDSLAQWEKDMQDMKSGKPDPNMKPEDAEEMSKYSEMYLTGKREIFQITE